MNVKERYNAIISDIEVMASDRYKIVQDIALDLTKKYAIHIRDLNAVFNFMTGVTVAKYIKYRKLMAAYKYLIRATKWDKTLVDAYIEISGLSDQSSFGKAFTTVFGKSPKEAFKDKDNSLITPPSTWDIVSCNENSVKGDCNAMDDRTWFGVSKDQHDRIVEVYELECLYGFDHIFSEVAVEIAEDLDVSLAEAFRYMDALHDFGGNYSGEDDDPQDPYYSLRPAIENLREDALNEYYQFAFFKCNISIVAAAELVDHTIFNEDKLMKMDPTLLREYALIDYELHINFQIFTKAYKYYMQHKPSSYGDGEYEQFLENLADGYYVETAFNAIKPGLYDDTTYI